MFDGDVIFDLFSGDSFDKFIVLFNSRIFVWEVSGGINC